MQQHHKKNTNNEEKKIQQHHIQQKQAYVFTKCPLAKLHICFSFAFISIYCNYIMNYIILVSQEEMEWVIYVLQVHMIWKIDFFDNVQYTKRNKASSKK